MSRFTAIIGLCLVVLGGVSYAASHGASLTALIPVAFGIIYVVLGVVSDHKATVRKHLMHAAAVLSLVGILANSLALVSAIQGLTGTPLPHPLATYSRAIMLLLCAIHLIAAARSFAAARLRPSPRNQAPGTV